MRRKLLVVVGLGLVVAACATEDPAGTGSGPEIVATTSPPATTVATTAPATTGAPTTTPSTTAAPTTTTTTTTLPLSELRLELVEVARGFEQPVLAIAPPGDPRLFVVDQPGRIWVVAGDTPELFADLSGDVVFGGERGLLGLAFHPDYAANGRLFVNFTGSGGHTRIAELQADPDGRRADTAGMQVLLEIDQPASNHNGGMIAFGPDGYLYVATGDGGGANDRFGQGQRPDTLLGALLRIDVAVPGEYSIPPDNPFTGGGGAPEVWSYGLRNPWRFAFDEDRIFIADVGQNRVEEINVAGVIDSKGANFGWPIFEGTDCFAGPCDEPLQQPAYVYGHDEGCSVTGGFVYRGRAAPELAGHYFFADYCAGWVRSLAPDGTVHEWFGAGVGDITSFGQDAAGEVYVVVAAGSIYRIDRAEE